MSASPAQRETFAGQPATVLLLPPPALHDQLADALGADAVAAVTALLWDRAREWAESAFGTAAIVTPAARPGGELDVAAAVREAFAASAGDALRPVILAVPELADWPLGLATAVLDDLAAGCAISVGPVFDGGFYLLGIARPIPALLAELAADSNRRDSLADVVAVATRDGLEVGLLRAERALRRMGDARALLADPATGGELRELLGV